MPFPPDDSLGAVNYIFGPKLVPKQVTIVIHLAVLVTQCSFKAMIFYLFNNVDYIIILKFISLI